MSRPQKLVVPAGVRFEFGDDGVSIAHEGDIVIHGDLGRPFAGVTSTGGSITLSGEISAGDVTAEAGSVELAGTVQAESVQAAGKVVLSGKVALDRVRARSIEARSGSLDARGIQAGEHISLGPVQVRIDAVIAPRVELDPRTAGRVAVIECDNDLGPNALKGGFSLDEFADFTGQDPAAFLAERGLEALAASRVPEQPIDELEELEPEPLGPDEAASEPAEAQPAEPEPVEPGPVEDRSDGDTADLLRERLLQTVERISDCYAGGELPPAVSELRGLITEGRYTDVRSEITNLWNSLLKFHQRHGLRIQHQVTTTFNTINTIVRKLDAGA